MGYVCAGAWGDVVTDGPVGKIWNQCVGATLIVCRHHFLSSYSVEYELMKYRTTQDVKLPFRVTPLVQESGNRIDITINIKVDRVTLAALDE